MMSYLSRLKQLDGGENFTHSPQTVPPKLTKGGYGGFVSAVQGAYANISAENSSEKVGAGEMGLPAVNTAGIPLINGRKSDGVVGAAMVKSCGWLLHYVDRDPVHVFIVPNETHAEILAAHPEAVAAEPVAPCQPVITGEKQALDPEAWEERAAICEFDGGLDRAEAEAVAWQEDDQRRCDHCQHYRREVCTIATPGGLVSANRGYRPWQGLPRRCAGFAARQELKP